MEELPKINIIYEDNHLLVIEKKPNIPVCSDSSKDEDLLSIIKKYLKIKYNKPGNVYVGMVHRLDRPVGGIMVFAKTSKAASRLSAQIKEHKFEKIYYAVLEGKAKKSDTLIDYLEKDKRKNISFVTDENHGKFSRLKYDLIGYKDGVSLVKIKLDTGRSHQIRVQFASRGLALVGDCKYNINGKHAKNIALFAKKLTFYHPISKEKLSFELNIPGRYPFNLF